VSTSTAPATGSNKGAANVKSQRRRSLENTDPPRKADLAGRTTEALTPDVACQVLLGVLSQEGGKYDDGQVRVAVDAAGLALRSSNLTAVQFSQLVVTKLRDMPGQVWHRLNSAIDDKRLLKTFGGSDAFDAVLSAVHQRRLQLRPDGNEPHVSLDDACESLLRFLYPSGDFDLDSARAALEAAEAACKKHGAKRNEFGELVLKTLKKHPPQDGQTLRFYNRFYNHHAMLREFISSPLFMEVSWWAAEYDRQKQNEQLYVRRGGR
jgi:hypothetical protein